jgi:dynein assembly factor with WDR repeat domains 1
MDKTAILWNLETEQLLMQIDGHQGEVISISFNTDGDKILTGSFDYTAKVNLNFYFRCGITIQVI